MSARGTTIRTLLRVSSTTLRQTQPQTTQLQTRALSQLHSRSPSPPCVAPRNLTISNTQWTHYSTPYSFSSVRTFTSSRVNLRPASPNPEPKGAETDPQAAQHIEEAIEEIQELYGTARDEFEIAAEETEKNTTYAPDDRAAAREELDKLLEFYNGIIEGPDRAVAEEVKRRVGQRIRELEQAVLAMEERASHHD